jgi:hypothetical protein
MAGRYHNVRLADCASLESALDYCRERTRRGYVAPVAVYEFPGDSVRYFMKARAVALYRYYPNGIGVLVKHGQ